MEDVELDDDIILWSDGSWCYRAQLMEYPNQPDKYFVIPNGAENYKVIQMEEEGHYHVSQNQTNI